MGAKGDRLTGEGDAIGRGVAGCPQTGMRPFTCPMTVSMTAVRSASESFDASPADPRIVIPFTPRSTTQSVGSAGTGTSSEPASASRVGTTVQTPSKGPRADHLTLHERREQRLGPSRRRWTQGIIGAAPPAAEQREDQRPPRGDQHDRPEPVEVESGDELAGE
jgi:hypothetical protein